MSAARLHRVLPRAVATAYIAAPRRRQTMHLTDRTAAVRFLLRDVDAGDAEVLRTVLGDCLVTTPEQTVLDLAHLHDATLDTDVRAATGGLLPRCNDDILAEIVSHVLTVIAARLPDAVIFFGGTALSRTHLVDGRLSEDVDLVATGSRRFCRTSGPTSARGTTA